MNPDDIQDQLKKLEVFSDGHSLYKWEPVVVGDLPHAIVFSKTDRLLWGRELLQAIVDSQATVQVVELSDADRVVAEWINGTVEVISDDKTK